MKTALKISILLTSLLSIPSFAKSNAPAKPAQVQKAKPVKTTAKVKTPVVLPKVISGISLRYIEEALELGAKEAQVPAILLKAICQTESNLTPDAFVRDDAGEGRHAFGMCQVLVSTATKYLNVGEGCTKDYTDRSLPRTAKTCVLFGPRVNAKVAALYLKEQIERYQGDLIKGTAAYNSGSFRTCGSSGLVKKSCGSILYTCTPGEIMNQRYLDRVDGFMDSTISQLVNCKDEQKPQVKKAGEELVSMARISKGGA